MRRCLLIALLAAWPVFARAATPPSAVNVDSYAHLALNCIHQQYPNHLSLAVGADADERQRHRGPGGEVRAARAVDRRALRRTLQHGVVREVAAEAHALPAVAADAGGQRGRQARKQQRRRHNRRSRRGAAP